MSRRRGGRRKGTRKTLKRVFISCEDEVSCPNYIRALRDDLGLSSHEVVVDGSSGSDPMSVVQHGLRVFKRGGYRTLFCVFDRDQFPNQTFEGAKARIRQAKRNHLRTAAIVSYPCFEYWVLIHFDPIAPQYHGMPGGKSPCERLIRDDLRQHIPGYDKSNTDVYDLTKDRIDDAIEVAKRREQAGLKEGPHSTRTYMHKLVRHLRKMAER